MMARPAHLPLRAAACLARGRQRVFVIGAFLASLIGPAPIGQAQSSQALDWDENSGAVLRFSSARWSMILPNRDFEGGCVVGFLAFQFSPTGYFIFNNRIRGAWRIDELGNLKLRTRDGLPFTLIVEDSTLRATRNLPFLRRGNLFQQCPE
jgi:hypothetical protein